MPRPLGRWLLPFAVALAVTAGACSGGGEGASGPNGGGGTGGGSGGSRPAGGGQEVAIDAEEFAYDPEHLTVPAGEVTFRLRNTGALVHDLRIEGEPVFVEAAPGKLEAVDAHLAPGKYTFFCSIPGHRSAGMEGTLQVR